jgi:hypothetical protein
MKLAGFDVRAKTDALGQAIKGRQHYELINYCKKIMTLGAKLEASYWVSATQIKCVGTWHFCNTDTVHESGITWASGQPDNWKGTEDYAAVDLDLVGGKILLNDRHIDRIFPYLCEGPA